MRVVASPLAYGENPFQGIIAFLNHSAAIKLVPFPGLIYDPCPRINILQEYS